MESGKLLEVALDAARIAAQIHQRCLGRVKPDEVSLKGVADFVSYVDREAEAAIVERIHATFPDHVIMAEEAVSASYGEGARDWSKVEWLWLVDPLDGTANFLHRYPAYCASVAVAHRGKLVAAAVVSGPTNEEWCATAAGGATLNGDRIRVSNVLGMDAALIGSGFPFKNHPLLSGYLNQFDAVMRNAADVRRAGAAALDLCHVATGYFDGFWELDLFTWDFAAGALIIQEAGGVITFTVGDDFAETDVLPFGRGGVIAGNPTIHSQLSALLRSAGARA
jgi:myo-inositol-1(or 4)-monophosphatase